MVPNFKGSLQRSQYPRRDGGRFRGVLQTDGHQRKFVAAQPRQRIALAHAGLQPQSQRLQQRIARRMPQAVVDHLEPVQVDVKESHQFRVPVGTQQGLLQPVGQQHAVGQASQRIVVRLACQVFLQLHHPHRRAHPRAQFTRVKWLGDVVVGSRLQRLDNVFLLRPRREQNHVDVAVPLLRPHPAADFQPVQPGHHPVQNRQPRAGVILQQIPGLRAAARQHHLVVPFGQ
jgi:hypothetical protein